MSGWGTEDDPVRISEINFHALPDSYPGAVLMGTPYERGYTYGKVFGGKIVENVARCLDRPDIPSV